MNKPGHRLAKHVAEGRYTWAEDGALLLDDYAPWVADMTPGPSTGGERAPPAAFTARGRCGESPAVRAWRIIVDGDCHPAGGDRRMVGT
jgi:hypothetical protein